MCGLDYSAVNKHAYSFIAFSLFCSVFTPFCVIVYFVLRLHCCCRGSHRSISERRAYYGAETDGDSSTVTRYVSYSGVIALLCDVPHLTTSLASVAGIALPPGSHFASSLLLYAQFAFPALLFLVAKVDASACAYSTDRSCWSTPATRRRENSVAVFEMRKTLLCAQPYAHTSASMYRGRTWEGSGTGGEVGDLTETAV